MMADTLLSPSMESLKVVRHRHGVSLTEAAAASGLHREAIARAERVGTDPRASTLLALARALNVPVCELFGTKGGHGRRRASR